MQSNQKALASQSSERIQQSTTVPRKTTHPNAFLADTLYTLCCGFLKQAQFVAVPIRSRKQGGQETSEAVGKRKRERKGRAYPNRDTSGTELWPACCKSETAKQKKKKKNQKTRKPENPPKKSRAAPSDESHGSRETTSSETLVSRQDDDDETGKTKLGLSSVPTTPRPTPPLSHTLSFSPIFLCSARFRPWFRVSV